MLPMDSSEGPMDSQFIRTTVLIFTMRYMAVLRVMGSMLPRCVGDQVQSPSKDASARVPRIASDDINLYKPITDVFRGLTQARLLAEQTYNAWVRTVHYFARDEKGNWHRFVCGWDGVWDRKDFQGPYQHKADVHQSDDLLRFDAGSELTVLDAYAPEILQDETGEWHISSVQCPCRGVSITRLAWD